MKTIDALSSYISAETVRASATAAAASLRAAIPAAPPAEASFLSHVMRRAEPRTAFARL